MNNMNNPYVGPRTFTPAESDRFFGRETEARELLALVISARLVLFYARSGAGKSSLINTRLVPRLAEEGFLVLPVGRVGGELPEGVTEVDNVFIFNLLLNLEQRQQDPSGLAHMTLSHFLANLTTTDGQHFYYDDLLPDAGVDDDLAADETYEEPPHVLIIDQFEEILTTHPSRWPERADFFRQLNQVMHDDPLLWIVLTMREDYVAALDPFATLLTNRLSDRYYMQRMSFEAALEAVKKPAEQYGRSFAPNVAETLIDNLRQIRNQDQRGSQLGQFVEPVQLQVVCYQLWENLKGGSANEITKRNLQEAGDVDTALAEFYEHALRESLQGTAISEIELRIWFDQQLITEARTRGTVYQGESETAGMTNQVVKRLTNQFLLRAELRAGGIWYELIHDRFIEPILQSNQNWRDRQGPLTQAAMAWDEAGRTEAKLLVGQQLEDMLTDINRNNLEPLVATFLEASDRANQALLDRETARRQELEQAQKLAEVQTRAAKQMRRFIIGLVLVLLLALSALFFALQQLRLATARQLAASSQLALSQNNMHLATLLGWEANKLNKQEGSNILGQIPYQAHYVKGDVLAGYTSGTSNVSWSPEGGRLASGLGKNIVVWGMETGEIEVNLIGHTAEVEDVAWHPNGHHLASGSQDNSIIIWDTEAGKIQHTLLGHTKGVRKVMWSPDGRRLASSSNDNSIIVWDVETGEAMRNLTGHTDSVLSVTWSPDGDRLASGSDDNSIIIWDTRNGEALTTLTGHTNRVWDVVWSPDGHRLASSSDDTTIIIWDTDSGEALTTLIGHSGGIDETVFFSTLIQGWRTLSFAEGVLSVDWSPDGDRLASSSKDGTIIIWDIESSNILMTLTGHAQDVTSVVWNPDGHHLASSSDDNSIIIWDIEHTEAAITLLGHSDWVGSLAWSSNNRLASGSDDDSLIIWDIESGKAITTLAKHTDNIHSIDWSPDGSRLASGSKDSNVIIWDVESGEALTTLSEHTDLVWVIAWSPDGDLLASGAWDDSIIIWDTEQEKALTTLGGHTKQIDSLAWSPDGDHLASGAQDNTIIIWNPRNGETLTALTTGPSFNSFLNGVSSLAWSPDGHRLASGEWDGDITIWDIENEEVLITLPGHRASITDLSWSPDGRRLTSSSVDSNILIWDMESGQELTSFTNKPKPKFRTLKNE